MVEQGVLLPYSLLVAGPRLMLRRPPQLTCLLLQAWLSSSWAAAAAAATPTRQAVTQEKEKQEKEEEGLAWQAAAAACGRQLLGTTLGCGREEASVT